MTPPNATTDLQTTVANIRARLDQLATLTAGDRAHVAVRQAERRKHKAAMRERKADRRALEASEGPIWLVPVDQVPARSTRPIRPIPYALTNRR
ncbi:hypothetical protein [Corynebacterium variabile]|uniref:hypothetical protein n=1 Tax=Corynebacterium variabile TaxID=1727 RepID=UPI003FD21949